MISLKGKKNKGKIPIPILLSYLLCLFWGVVGLKILKLLKAVCTNVIFLDKFQGGHQTQSFNYNPNLKLLTIVKMLRRKYCFLFIYFIFLAKGNHTSRFVQEGLCQNIIVPVQLLCNPFILKQCPWKINNVVTQLLYPF